MSVGDALRTAGVVGSRARGSSYEDVLDDAFRRGELRGAPVPMELPEETTYAWLLEPLLEAGGLSRRWRVTRHGFGATLETLYSEADGIVVLESADGRRLEERADERWSGRWYDHDVVERLLVALTPELPRGKAFYAVGRGLPPDHPEFPSDDVWTVLDAEGAHLLREVGLDVRRIGERDGEAPP